MIEPVDSLEVTVIVDNVTDILSSNPEYVETEVAGAWRRGMKWLGGKCLCCAAHGLSCLITARIGDTSHSLLFDYEPDANSGSEPLEVQTLKGWRHRLCRTSSTHVERATGRFDAMTMQN